MVDPTGDDGIDHQFGVLCTDGAFTQPAAWPEATKCTAVPTCPITSNPPADTLLESVTEIEIAEGSSVTYACKDPEAILGDTGLSAFQLTCEGSALKNTDGTAFDGVFPTCRSQCKDFFNGNKQFTAR